MEHSVWVSTAFFTPFCFFQSFSLVTNTSVLFLQGVQMGMFVWSMAPLIWRVELKCVTTMHTAQCVMTSGMSWRPEWSVHNWDLVERVRLTALFAVHSLQ